MTSRGRYRLAGAMLSCLLTLAPTAGAQPLTTLRPAEPQPAQVTPGLAVEYTYARVNYIEQLKGRKFESGPPLANLNYRWGGNVLTSKDREDVGAIITGFIRFDKPGVYGFEVTSNDGVLLEMAGRSCTRTPGFTQTAPRTASTSRSISPAGILSGSSTSRRRAPRRWSWPGSGRARRNRYPCPPRLSGTSRNSRSPRRSDSSGQSGLRSRRSRIM